MFVNLDEDCYVCKHPWRWHEHLEGFSRRHLVGGWEYAPLYCYCTFEIPQTNLEYLEYMDTVQGMKSVEEKLTTR